ncbi:MAG: hypothetical protein HQK56_20665, partial [Deltaproteobacteria bacterium]|nr:hypothetical protein [Deltaproteobacteria bacterium]
MKPHKKLLWLPVVVIGMITLLAVAGLDKAFADSSLPPGGITLFTDLPAPRGADAKPDHTIIRSRWVKVNFNLITGLDLAPGVSPKASQTIALNLFPDVEFTGVIERSEVVYQNNYSLVGRLEGVPDSSIIMSVQGDIVSANITVPGAFYQVRYVSPGVHAIYEINQGAFPPELPPIPVDSSQKEMNAPPKASARGIARSDDGSSIDVMVLYTTTSKNAAGGTAAMNSTISLAVAETNQGYANSGVTQRIRLVHTEEVTYDETAFDWNTTLNRLTGTSDGYMDNIHATRDAYGADEVVLLVEDTTYCGLAWLMTTLSNSFKTNAFAVVARTCATGYYSFAHEMGHNMGCNHDRANAGGQGLYTYSYGYQELTNHSFRTIMAYDCAGTSCPRINYWSNPDVSYTGLPTGVVYTAGNSADNRRTLNSSAYTVANFRTSVSGTTLLWSGTGGAAGIWTLDSSNNLSAYKQYGPYSGWTPVSLSYNPSDSTKRTLLWSGTGGIAGIWTLDSSNNLSSYKQYGPYSGWTPVSFSYNPSDRTQRMLSWGWAGGEANRNVDSTTNQSSCQKHGRYCRRTRRAGCKDTGESTQRRGR